MTDLQTFQLPDSVDEAGSDIRLACDLVNAWARDGIIQLAMTAAQRHKAFNAIEAGIRFFQMPMEFKSAQANDLSYSGYARSGAGESFMVGPDVEINDPRVRAKWPCHGPVPWPDEFYRTDTLAFLAELETIGEKLLRLTALGLELPDPTALTSLTGDGWHHLRMLRFSADSSAHTDYGLLVITYQDEAGGLYIRPPVEGEQRDRNWLHEESTTGRYENDEPWLFVKPVPDVLTVYPGDLMQLLTDGAILATPHRIRLGTVERLAVTYFHEPGFNACVRPLMDPTSTSYIHYGTHFTNTFMRGRPDRSTTGRIHAEDRLAVLDRLRAAAVR
jgi:isopenicillin N synthase-like dioxygenase